MSSGIFPTSLGKIIRNIIILIFILSVIVATTLYFSDDSVAFAVRTINYYQQRYYYQEPHHHHGHHHHQSKPCPKPCSKPCPMPCPTPKPTSKPTPKPTECSGVHKDGPFKGDLFAMKYVDYGDNDHLEFERSEDFALDFNDDGTIVETAFSSKLGPEDGYPVVLFDGFYVKSLNELSFKWYGDWMGPGQYFSFDLKWNYKSHQYEGSFYFTEFGPNEKSYAVLKPAQRIDCIQDKLTAVDNICDEDELFCCVSDFNCADSSVCQFYTGTCVQDFERLDFEEP